VPKMLPSLFHQSVSCQSVHGMWLNQQSRHSASTTHKLDAETQLLDAQVRLLEENYSSIRNNQASSLSHVNNHQSVGLVLGTPSISTISSSMVSLNVLDNRKDLLQSIHESEKSMAGIVVGSNYRNADDDEDDGEEEYTDDNHETYESNGSGASLRGTGMNIDLSTPPSGTSNIGTGSLMDDYEDGDFEDDAMTFESDSYSYSSTNNNNNNDHHPDAHPHMHRSTTTTTRTMTNTLNNTGSEYHATMATPEMTTRRLNYDHDLSDVFVGGYHYYSSAVRNSGGSDTVASATDGGGDSGCASGRTEDTYLARLQQLNTTSAVSTPRASADGSLIRRASYGGDMFS